MNEQMVFPVNFEDFVKMYSIVDDEKVYTNGIELIPVFRVKQWLEQDNKLRALEMDTAYECGKHVDKRVPVTERLPEKGQRVVVFTPGDYATVCLVKDDDGAVEEVSTQIWFYPKPEWGDGYAAWMPLPEVSIK